MGNKLKKPGYGSNCSVCGKPLGKYQITGYLGGGRVYFCSFRCQDTAMDNHSASIVKEVDHGTN